MQTIQFFHEGISRIKINRKAIRIFIFDLIKKESKTCGDISFIFCSDQYLLPLNKKYLKHDYYTDVITFNYCENDIISGDIFISAERIRDNYIKHNTEFFNELYRVMFHGILHLIGYNDKTADEKKLMKEKEDFYLNEFLKQEDVA